MKAYPHLIKLLFIITVVFSPFIMQENAVKAASKGKVYVLHSYHKEYAWTKGINEAITRRLSEVGIEHTFYYMDTKRKSSLAWKKKAGELARKQIEEYRPDVVIAVDDNAKNYGISPYIGKKWPYLVFCGINDNKEVHHYPPKNMTGIFERTYIHQTLDLLKTLTPGIEKVVFLSDDSNTARLIKDRAKNYKSEGSLPVDLIGFNTPSTFAEWQAVIKKYDQDKDVEGFLIPVYHTIKRGENGTAVKPSEVMHWTTTNTRKPIVGLGPFSTADGALAVVAVDPHEHGWTAADMAIKIISGTPISTMLPTINKAGSVHFNVSTAEMLGIEVSYDLLESFDVIVE